MQGIFDGIQNIINGIMLIVNFIVNLVKSIFQLFELLMTMVQNATLLILTLPSWLIAVATATLGITILYMMIGRDTGK